MLYMLLYTLFGAVSSSSQVSRVFSNKSPLFLLLSLFCVVYWIIKPNHGMVAAPTAQYTQHTNSNSTNSSASLFFMPETHNSPLLLFLHNYSSHKSTNFSSTLPLPLFSLYQPNSDFFLLLLPLQTTGFVYCLLQYYIA